MSKRKVRCEHKSSVSDCEPCWKELNSFTPKELQEILEHIYETAIQDWQGVSSGRKGYRLRHDEVPKRATKALELWAYAKGMKAIGEDATVPKKEIPGLSLKTFNNVKDAQRKALAKQFNIGGEDE